jgi:hypothetical protein
MMKNDGRVEQSGKWWMWLEMSGLCDYLVRVENEQKQGFFAQKLALMPFV